MNTTIPCTNCRQPFVPRSRQGLYCAHKECQTARIRSYNKGGPRGRPLGDNYIDRGYYKRKLADFKRRMAKRGITI